jgi:hypothetical protein
LNANTINDLVVQSDERKYLWKALRDRASQSQSYGSGIESFDLDPETLAALLGIKELKEGYEQKESNGP